MERKHRTRLGILLEVLETINSLGEASITEIITHANIPHNRLKKILDGLVRKKYVAERTKNRRKLFALTPKGFELMRQLEHLKRIIEGLGLNI